MSMPKYWVILLILLLGVTIDMKAQDEKWILRIGMIGTGTGDLGLWGFNDNTGLGTQEFVFSNSWGVALDGDYLLTPRWLVGVHFALSRTSFGLNLNDNGSIQKLRSNTSFNPLMVEIKHRFRPEKLFRPYLGVTGGILLTKDPRLPVLGQQRTFEFADKSIYGLVFGFEWQIGNKGLSIHSLIRAVTFEYTLQETDISREQTLLDQNWWQNFNHIQLGVSKSL